MFLSNFHSIDIHVLLEPSLQLVNLHIIAAHHSLLHLPVLVESPVLESICSSPHSLALLCELRVAVLIPELHCNLVLGKCEGLFAQAIVEFSRPFRFQEINDCGAAADERRPIAPDGVWRVSKGTPLRVSARGVNGVARKLEPRCSLL